MYEEYIGQEMSEREAYITFVDHWFIGQYTGRKEEEQPLLKILAISKDYVALKEQVKGFRERSSQSMVILFKAGESRSVGRFICLG